MVNQPLLSSLRDRMLSTPTVAYLHKKSIRERERERVSSIRIVEEQCEFPFYILRESFEKSRVHSREILHFHDFYFKLIISRKICSREKKEFEKIGFFYMKKRLFYLRKRFFWLKPFFFDSNNFSLT